MTTSASHPVAVGGIGGSGTRVLATFLQMLGYFLGDDLNEALDNLWFTLLFKRRSILLESRSDFCDLLNLLTSRMTTNAMLSEQAHARILGLADRERLQHSRSWLLERAFSFTSGKTQKGADQPWGWKEPNSHIVIDRIFTCDSNLRYIHVVRHPLDMVISRNRNQLQNWGPVLLSRDVTLEPKSSLSYWCAAHRRMMNFVRACPDWAMMLDFDSFCQRLESHCTKIAGFLRAG